MQHDRENFFGICLLRHEHQRILFAIRALNIEIALATAKVRNEDLAMGRLIFWESEIKRKAETEDSPPPGEGIVRTPVRVGLTDESKVLGSRFSGHPSFTALSPKH